VHLSVGEAGSPSNTMWPGPRPTSVPTGILIQPFGHNRHGPKTGRCCALFGHNVHGPKIGGYVPFWEGELGPHLRQWGLGRVLTKDTRTT